MKPYSYFARAIRGGRENLENCRIIVDEMEKYSTVLSKHVIYKNVEAFERRWAREHPRIDVNQRDLRWIRKSKYFVADVTVESTGAGFEMVFAKSIEIPRILFRHEQVKNKPTMWIHTTYFDRTIEISLEDLMRVRDPDTSIIYYNDENIGELAERGIENFFHS